jgi:hypothetical protein
MGFAQRGLTTMNTTFSQEIERDLVLAPRVRAASQTLDQVGGASGRLVTAEWTLASDASGRRQVVLRLSDFTGVGTEAVFDPGDFADERLLRFRLYTVWGDLLQARSHRQFDVLSGRVEP